MKRYSKPVTEIVVVNYENTILSGSGLATGGRPGDEFTSTDVSYSRDGFFDDED